MNSEYIKGILRKLLLILLAMQLLSCGMIYRQMKQKMKENYREGISLYKRGKYADAMDKFQEVISIDPDHRGAKRYIIITQEAMEKSSRAHYLRALKYKRAGSLEKALDEFLIVMKKDPDYRDTRSQVDSLRNSPGLLRKFEWTMKLAERYYGRKRYKSAYIQCLKAEKYKPESLELSVLERNIESALKEQSSRYVRKGEDLYNRRRYTSARKYLKRALRVNPWDKEAKELLKKCNSKIYVAKLYDRAKKKYKKRDYFAAYELFQSVDRREPGFRDTRSYIERSKNLLSKYKWKYYNSGIAYYDKEQFKKAIAQWNKVLKIDPDHKKAREYKERALAKLAIKRSLED